MPRWTIATLDTTEQPPDHRKEIERRLRERLGETTTIIETSDGSIAVFKRGRAVEALVDVFERADTSGWLHVLTVNNTTETGDVFVYEVDSGIARSIETIRGVEGYNGVDAVADAAREYGFLPVSDKSVFF